MRPVRVSSPGASFSMPLRMAAIGTGVTVGITIWVVSDGRYQPQNFPFFHIEDSALVWDWSTSSSNYTTLRAQNEALLKGRGWEIESSISLNEQLITNVITSGGQYYGGGGVGSYPVSDPSEDYLPVGGSDDGGVGGADAGDNGGATMTADQVRTQDVGDLFAGMMGPNVRVTRIRSDISHAAMTTDFVIEASPDQTEMSNVHNLTNGVNYQCPIYNNCQVVGAGSPSEATATTGTSSAGAPFYASKSGGGGAWPRRRRRRTRGHGWGFSRACWGFRSCGSCGAGGGRGRDEGRATPSRDASHPPRSPARCTRSRRRAVTPSRTW